MRRPFRTLIRAVSTFQTLQVWVKSLGFLMESMVPWIINLDLFPFSQLPLGEQCKPGECPECWPDHLTTHPCQQDILLRNPVHMCHGPKTRIGHQSKRDVYTKIYKIIRIPNMIWMTITVWPWRTYLYNEYTTQTCKLFLCKCYIEVNPGNISKCPRPIV